tara:strand:- start:754 stop:918 length:165 start_codon:yes stop_codon:yes gene_type:complete
MIYLLSIVILLQSFFWLGLRIPTIALDSILEFKILNLLILASMIWIFTGKTQDV